MRQLLRVALALGFAVLPASAQTTGPPPAVEVALALRQLDGVKRVLLVAAHPDDEDTHLLAALARGMGADVGYFSFTRGEGGQNLIGPELGEGLGIVRSGELLAARERDGARQFFSRAYDFGYSKNAEETFAHWDREALLSDLVWTVRQFRPQILVSIFSGTPSDGHGQHQAAGLLAREAFQAAADPDRFPEQIRAGARPWQPSKLYRRTYFDPEAATLVLPGSGLDPLLGRSWLQLAMEARSQHRSQDFGIAQDPGPSDIGLARLDASPEGETSLFTGVDTAFASTLDELPPATRDRAALAVEAYRSALDTARSNLSLENPERILPALLEARARLAELGELSAASARAHRLYRLVQRRAAIIESAVATAAGLRFDVRTRQRFLLPGREVLVEVRLWNGFEHELSAVSPELGTPAGWVVRPLGADASVGSPDRGLFARPDPSRPADAFPGASVRLGPGEVVVWRFEVRLPEDAEPSQPYYLRQPRETDMYAWTDDPALRNRPFAPAPIQATVRARLEGAGSDALVTVSREARYRGVDKAKGEYWRPVAVVPPLSIEPAADLLVWPVADRDPRELVVSVRSLAPERLAAEARLAAPDGWRVDPVATALDLPAGGTASVRFRITPPEGSSPETTFLRPAVSFGDRRYTQGVQLIEYPHIEPRLLLTDATVEVRRFPVSVAQRSVGYVMGSGDTGPQAIRDLGLEPTMIESGDWGDLDRFDVIVLGVRAYEVRSDLIGNNDRLLDWVRRGGTLLVQYNKYEFTDGAFAPFPLVQNRPAPRVTDETAEVAILRPSASAVTEPNRIGAADFEHWVQERGLYFPDEWDERYEPLLSMHDPGEPERSGSVLIATLGEGIYVYTSLSFFRQFPAGVPGAYRLFANLLSLGADGGTAAADTPR